MRKFFTKLGRGGSIALVVAAAACAVAVAALIITVSGNGTIHTRAGYSAPLVAVGIDGTPSGATCTILRTGNQSFTYDITDAQAGFQCRFNLEFAPAAGNYGPLTPSLVASGTMVNQALVSVAPLMPGVTRTLVLEVSAVDPLPTGSTESLTANVLLSD